MAWPGLAECCKMILVNSVVVVVIVVVILPVYGFTKMPCFSYTCEFFVRVSHLQVFFFTIDGLKMKDV